MTAQFCPLKSPNNFSGAVTNLRCLSLFRSCSCDAKSLHWLGTLGLRNRATSMYEILRYMDGSLSLGVYTYSNILHTLLILCQNVYFQPYSNQFCYFRQPRSYLSLTSLWTYTIRPDDPRKTLIHPYVTQIPVPDRMGRVSAFAGAGVSVTRLRSKTTTGHLDSGRGHLDSEHQGSYKQWWAILGRSLSNSRRTDGWDADT